MLNNFFPKIAPLKTYVEKYSGDRGAKQMKSQYGAYALRAGLARLHACMRMHTPTRPGTHMHARTCAHTQMCKTLLFHGNNDSQTCLDITLYVHCLIIRII